MRITGGEFRGRKLKCPEKVTRPTQDRVREAMFSSLATIIPDCRFLDLFAGSGAVGLDASSRGAAAVTWVEFDKGAYRCLHDNVELIKSSNPFNQELECVRSDVYDWLSRLSNGHYDVVFADPPYDLGCFGEDTHLLDALAKSSLLADHSLVILESRKKADFFHPAGWDLVQEKVYGKTCLRYFRLNTSS